MDSESMSACPHVPTHSMHKSPEAGLSGLEQTIQLPKTFSGGAGEIAVGQGKQSLRSQGVWVESLESECTWIV